MPTTSQRTSALQDRPRTPANLLAAYTTEDLYFRSPRHALLARGRQAVLRGDVARRDLGRHANLAALSDAVAGGSGMVVGAIPFAGDEPAELFVPEQVLSVAAAAPARSPAARARCWEITAVPPVRDYEKSVAQGLALIEAGVLDKVVLARALDVRGDEPIDVPELLAALAARDSGGYTYAVPLAQGCTFLGASPELLVSRVGEQVFANPLAGSAPRSADPAEDRRRAEALLASAKDLREHAVVAEAVATALAPWCAELRVPPSPALVSTATMWHLSSPITGRVKSADTSALDLALALHPTPAVCGAPAAAATAAIAELEPFGRGFFAGTTGWVDSAGDGEWTVAIRCAETHQDTLRLFAGAGIVAGSTPAAEAAETGAKFATLLSALGIEHSA